MNATNLPRSWRDAVVDALERRARRGRVVDRHSLIASELGQIVAETHSRGRTPEQTLSRVLQDLREEGVLEFAGRGTYQLERRTVDVELAELTDSELDEAILSRLLRIGRVAADSVVSAARIRGVKRDFTT